MRSTLIPLAAVLIGFSGLPAAQAQEEFVRRIDAVRDGSVRLSFATRPEVCGDGRFIGEDTPDGFRTFTFWNDGYSINTYDHFQPECRQGPLRLVVEKAGGRIVDLDAAVGVTWRELAGVTDLGMAPAAAAATWLLRLAPQLDDRALRVALLAAVSAEGAPIANRLMAIARDRELRSEVRENAMRWVSDAARREGREADADRLLRSIVDDQGDVAAVRARAVRTLRPTADNDAFLRAAYGRAGDVRVKERILRRLGASESEANAGWLRSVVVDAGEPLRLRERALRVLGGDLKQYARVRGLYAQLDDAALKERALRVVADHDGAAGREWLRGIVENGREYRAVRERAIRLLAERGDVAYLREAYPRIDVSQLRDRVLREAGEHGTPGDLAWLERVVLDRGEALPLRERAIRVLGERGRLDFLQRSLGQLDAAQLRDRVVRLVAEARGADGADWLRGIVVDGAQPQSVRERAIRSLAERSEPTVSLVGLYDRVNEQGLRQRLVRIYAERADDAGIEKLVAIAQNDPSRDLRRYALRRLADTGHAKAREFLESTVRRP